MSEEWKAEARRRKILRAEAKVWVDSRNEVDRTIVAVIFPQLNQLIADLVGLLEVSKVALPKDLNVQVKKLLPKKYQAVK